MLQTRLENEQFNSLTNPFTTHRTRNDFITIDRPDSSQLVDLHIYLIPKSVWQNVQHLAQNRAMDDAISAGFVRVSPEMKLHHLRKSIEILCGKEDYFPRDFIFLRSVGRCLTGVKQRQENELKVKNYRPPQTLASEIYLLEGRHEDYGNIPCPSPALSSASYLFGNRRQHRFNRDEYGRIPSDLSHRKPLHTENNHLPIIHRNHPTSQFPSAGRKSSLKFTQIALDLAESSLNTSVLTSITSRELNKLREEQERLRQRQAELERMRRAAEEKKLSSEREENERQRLRREKTQLEREENERQRHRREKTQLEREEEARRRRQRRQEKAEAERRRLEQLELAATKIQATFRGYKDRQVSRERQLNFNSRKSSSESTPTNKYEKKLDLNDDELSDGSQILSGSSIGSTSDIDSNSSRPETRSIGKKTRDSLPTNSSLKKIKSKIPSNKSSSSSSYSKVEDLPMKTNTNNDEKNIRSATVTKIRPSDEEILPLSTPDINDDETYELKPREVDGKHRQQVEEEKRKDKELENQQRREVDGKHRQQIEEEKRKDKELEDQQRREVDGKHRQQIEEEKRKIKELEDQQRRELAKLQQHEDVETLRARLKELRARRSDLEKIRDEVIGRLKQMHQRITLQRKDARDMWKKKYFHEKKKTPAIEEHASRVKTDLDLIQNKIVQIIDNERKHATKIGCVQEAEAGNLVSQITRNQYEIEGLRYRVDQAKLRLTTDIKLRNQAENECRTLKHELGQAKMNVNHMKNQKEV